MRVLWTALYCTRQHFKTDFGFPYVAHKEMKRNCRDHTPLIAADVNQPGISVPSVVRLRGLGAQGGFFVLWEEGRKMAVSLLTLFPHPIIL